jgi:hypothetical protein
MNTNFEHFPFPERTINTKDNLEEKINESILCFIKFLTKNDMTLELHFHSELGYSLEIENNKYGYYWVYIKYFGKRLVQNSSSLNKNSYEASDIPKVIKQFYNHSFNKINSN